MDFWISKYALSSGIFMLRDAELYEGVYASKHEGRVHHFYGKNDWHHSLDEAKKKSEAMRTKKIASLKAQIKKLEHLNFSTQSKGSPT
jgi:hypothetical protein